MTEEDLIRSQELQVEANNRLIEELAGKNSKLEESRKRFQDLVNHLPCVVLRFDNKGCIDYANETWTSFFGSLPESVVGRSLESLIHEDDRGSLFRSLKNCVTVELRFRQESGEFRWVRFSCQKFADDSYQCLLVDLMETRKLEELLRRSQKMEAIGRLSGGVAHNFNNLLTIIMASVDKLADSLSKGNDLSEIEVNRIQLAANEAASVTSQLLAFSRQQVLMPNRYEVKEILDECEILMSELLRSPDLDFLINKVGTEQIHVYVDKSQIHQVLMNIILNARDAVDGIGTISVTIGNVTVGPAEAADLDIDYGKYVSINVTDDGMGMSQQVQEKIFEPFFTTKEFDKGVGFGLATSYGIIQQSGGAIRVSSEVGEGSVFEVLLPISEAGEKREAKVLHPAIPEKAFGNILVVDDEEMILDLTCESLRDEGHQVTGMTKTTEALAELSNQEKRYDLLITDVVMPDGGGRRLVDYVKSMNHPPQVVVVSGYDRDFLGDDQDFGTFMQKPYSLADLIKQVGLLLSVSSK